MSPSPHDPHETSRALELAVEALAAIRTHIQTCVEQNRRIEDFIIETRRARDELQSKLEEIRIMMAKAALSLLGFSLTALGYLVVTYVFPHH